MTKQQEQRIIIGGRASGHRTEIGFNGLTECNNNKSASCSTNSSLPPLFPTHQRRLLSIPLLTILIVTCWLVPVSQAEECGHEELVQCAKPLQVISATSELSFVTNKAELDQICPDLNAGLHCIRSYTRRCMSITQRQHFNKLYHGTSQVIHELCTEGAYQEDFLRHAPCLRMVKAEYENCATAYQATMTDLSQNLSDDSENLNVTMYEAYQAERIRIVCCAFKKYVHCSEVTVGQSCGQEPAQFTKKFLDKMASSLMTMHCEEYDSNTDKCGLWGLSNGSHKPSVSSYWTMLIIPFLAVLLSSHRLSSSLLTNRFTMPAHLQD